MLACVGLGPASTGAELTISVCDSSGSPLANAVVDIAGGDGVAPAHPGPDAPTLVRQRGRVFVPYVTAVRAGSTVEFPNEDPFFHHVYSFSPTKTFEIRLYGEDQRPTVLFEQPGIVALGCNIHDQMQGYVYVSDAASFGVTAADGAFVFENLPPSTYEVVVWHPHMANGAGERVAVEWANAADRLLEVTVGVAPDRLDTVDALEAGGYE